MAYRENAKILKADCLADGVYEIWFETKDIAKAAKAGQFISVYSNDGSRMLPRPISICKVENNNLRIVFRLSLRKILKQLLIQMCILQLKMEVLEQRVMY